MLEWIVVFLLLRRYFGVMYEGVLGIVVLVVWLRDCVDFSLFKFILYSLVMCVVCVINIFVGLMFLWIMRGFMKLCK